MNKTELKEILKPLIKECIKECILEEGMLSGIVTEVANGLSSSNMVVESPRRASRVSEDEIKLQKLKEQQEAAEIMERDRQARIKRLNESMKTKLNDVNIFENTSPAAPEFSDAQAPGALSGVAPDDPGVDITGILNLAGSGWKRMI
jgi:hypothetical protein